MGLDRSRRRRGPTAARPRAEVGRRSGFFHRRRRADRGLFPEVSFAAWCLNDIGPGLYVSRGVPEFDVSISEIGLLVAHVEAVAAVLAEDGVEAEIEINRVLRFDIAGSALTKCSSRPTGSLATVCGGWDQVTIRSWCSGVFAGTLRTTWLSRRYRAFPGRWRRFVDRIRDCRPDKRERRRRARACRSLLRLRVVRRPALRSAGVSESRVGIQLRSLSG